METIDDLTSKRPTFDNALTLLPQIEGNPPFDQWDFNVWLLNQENLLNLTMCILNQFKIPETFGITSEIWCNLMDEVAKLMSLPNNPYHNFHHVVDVLQSTACMIKEFQGSRFLSDLDILALLVAAIIHDLEHPGTNNVYQVNAATPLAIRYNDISVLENHHASKAFEIFRSERTNIFSKLTTEQYKYVRKTIISLVLSTDMTNHFALKAELEECILRFQALTNAAASAAERPNSGSTKSNRSASPNMVGLINGGVSSGSTRNSFHIPPVVMTPADTLTIMKCILHAADISNPAKKWVISKLWSDRVLEEFFAQGDKEKVENLPVSMNCDRNTTKQDELSVNFCDFIVAPFFFTVTKLLPKTLLACKELRVNRTTWHNLICNRLRADASTKVAAGVDTAPIDASLASWEARQTDFSGKFADLASKYDTVVAPAPMMTTMASPRTISPRTAKVVPELPLFGSGSSSAMAASSSSASVGAGDDNLRTPRTVSGRRLSSRSFSALPGDGVPPRPSMT